MAHNGKIGSLEVVKYDFLIIDGNPKIVISMIKVLDTEGNYIKFCALKEVLPFLASYPIKFKPIQ